MTFVYKGLSYGHIILPATESARVRPRSRSICGAWHSEFGCPHRWAQIERPSGSLREPRDLQRMQALATLRVAFGPFDASAARAERQFVFFRLDEVAPGSGIPQP
jgi:hypothetical protein